MSKIRCFEKNDGRKVVTCGGLQAELRCNASRRVGEVLASENRRGGSPRQKIEKVARLCGGHTGVKPRDKS